MTKFMDCDMAFYSVGVSGWSRIYSRGRVSKTSLNVMNNNADQACLDEKLPARSLFMYQIYKR